MIDLCVRAENETQMQRIITDQHESVISVSSVCYYYSIIYEMFLIIILFLQA
jgi:hypothetical protein